MGRYLSNPYVAPSSIKLVSQARPFCVTALIPEILKVNRKGLACTIKSECNGHRKSLLEYLLSKSMPNRYLALLPGCRARAWEQGLSPIMPA